ncbi:MAG: hypothetical protein QM598_05655 [Protaetiibacter sp.]
MVITVTVAELQDAGAIAGEIRAAARMSQLSQAAREAIDSGGIVLELTAKPAVPRSGGPTRAQLLALAQIASHGLLFNRATGIALLPGTGSIHVSVVQALAARGGIAPDLDEDATGALWRLTRRWAAGARPRPGVTVVGVVSRP